MWAPIWPAIAGGRSGRCGAITNGVHVPTWISHELARLFDELPARRLARSPRRPGALGRASSTSPTRSCGRRAARCATTCSRSSASARASAGATSSVSAARVVAAGTLLDPERADHRLRAPLHRLQAARADLPRPRAAAGASSTPRGGRCRSSSPARRIRPTTPASTTCSRSTGARSIRVRRPHRVRRRLRPARRALPGAGLRRVAEQPAQAARGQRHQRHEGVDQRRAALLASATAGGPRATPATTAG